MVAKACGAYGTARIVNTDFPADTKFDYLPEEHTNQGPAAFLSVQEGCDKFCTFCVVPYTRGAEFSRPARAIIDEARKLIQSGVKEITLLGQNVNAWHGEGLDGATWGLGRLVEELADLEGLERIRYTTSHPRDMDAALIAAHRDVEKLMPFLHLPVQSGSDRILKLMNRKHTAETYYRIIEDLRKARPDIALSSDFIVGFPGETDQDFEDTMTLVREIGFASAYSFKYSPRPGTPAANMGGLVREDVKSERLQRLQALLNEQQLAFNRNSAGLEMPVLFDRTGRDEWQLHGRSPYNQAVYVKGHKRLIGEIMNVKITEGFANSLAGEIVSIGETALGAEKA